MDQHKCAHHWHDSGANLPNNGYIQVCCHCGEKRDYYPQIVPYNYYLPPPCGAYAPAPTHHHRIHLSGLGG